MNKSLRLCFETELQRGWELVQDRNLDQAFGYFERAHILGQRRTFLHVRAHWAMLTVGWIKRDRREILGQLARIAAALVFSRVWVPEGNTGGANVSAFERMSLPADLAELLGSANKPPVRGSSE